MTNGEPSGPPLEPMIGESAPSGAGAGAPPFGSHFERVQEIMRSAGDRWGAWRSIYDLYQEMEDKDGHLYSVLQTRKYGVLGRARQVLPAGEGRREVEVAEWVVEVLESTPGWDEALYGLLDSLGKGIAVVEVEWGYREGRAVPVGFRPRPPQCFVFDARGELRVLDPGQTLWWGTPQAVARSRPVSPARALVMVFSPTADNPYGTGLCFKAFWYHWFKKNTLKFWAIYNEKFGAPTVVGKYRSGASPQEQDRLMEVVESLQTDSGVAVLVESSNAKTWTLTNGSNPTINNAATRPR